MADTGKATIAAVVERLRTKASMIMLGEPIAWGSDSAVMDEAASLISALEAERDEARKLANQYAWERDKAREERDVAEYRSAAFWKPLNAKTVARAEAAEAQVATLQAKLEKAAEALKPFAWFSEGDAEDTLPDSAPIAIGTAVAFTPVRLIDMTTTMGDFRRARSTLYTLREASDA